MKEITVQKEELLYALDVVSAGLAKRETIEQSSCFIFQKGTVFTFNDEIACMTVSLFPEDFNMAVPSGKIREQLGKWKEPEIKVVYDQKKNQLYFKGKNKKIKISVEQKIVNSIDNIEKPIKWKKLDSYFCDALTAVLPCVGSEEADVTSCVHIHPKWIEAFDKIQLCRWRMQTRFEKPLLIRGTSAKHISMLGMSYFSETENWIHFKNDVGVVLSCRKYMEEFPSLGAIFKMEDSIPLSLPKSLMDSASNAKIFTSENPDEDLINVKIDNQSIRVIGRGLSGVYVDSKKTKGVKEPMSFYISPSILMEIVKKHTSCLLTKAKLFVKTENYKYVTCLSTGD